MYENCDEGLTEEDFMQFISDEYWDTMLGKFSKDDRDKYSKEIAQFHYVVFKQKLGVVIRHHKNKS